MSQLSVIESIFNRALEISAAEELDGFLDDQCPSAEIRQQVERLLAVHPHVDSFLAQPPEQLTDASSDLVIGLEIGSEVGPYKIREQIGEGGMGIVYVAEQSKPVRRKVALKVIKPGMDTKEVIARFEAERQALAVMGHPNIATVLDAGATEQGHPYFAMELVRGIPITEYCDQARLGPRERLKLFNDVCHAVQHAHQKGIIHRDIKPSNVLVTQINGKPIIKVIDFGLAKATDSQRLTDKSLYTGFMKIMGTPTYMSPEQAGLSGLDVDTRSDVYSLGVMLYEILTGTTPLDTTEFESRDYEKIYRQIREVEAPKPSTRISSLQSAQRTEIAQQRRISSHELRQMLHGDLDRVVLKSLDKNRDHRYQTPQELAADIGRYLDDQPIHAVAPSPLYLLRKFARRRRGLIATVGTIAGLLVVGIIVSTLFAINSSRAEQRAIAAKQMAETSQKEAEAARRLAEASERRIRRIAYASDMNLVERELSRGNVGRARELLDRHRPQPGETELRGWEWRYLWLQCQSTPHRKLAKAPDNVKDVSFSYDGKLISVTSREDVSSRVSIRERDSGVEIAAWKGIMAYFSPTEPWLVYWSNGENAQEADTGSGEGFRLWNVETRRVEKFLPIKGWFYRGVGFSGDGRVFAVATTDNNKGDERKLVFWSIPDGERLPSIPAGYVSPGSSYPFALAKDMSVVAHGVGNASQCTFRLVDLKSQKQLWESPPVPAGQWVESMALSPDNELLAVSLGTISSEIQIWNVQKGVRIRNLSGHLAYVKHLLFLPDGKTLVSAGADQSVRLWDLTDLDNVPSPRVWQGHQDEVSHLAASPDGKTLVSGCRDGSVFLWDNSAATRRDPSDIVLSLGDWSDWTITPDKSAIISCNADGSVSRRTGPRFEQEEKLLQFGETFHRGSISEDGTQVAAGYANGEVKLWDIAQKKVIGQFKTNDGAMVPRGFLAGGEILKVRDHAGKGGLFLWNWKVNKKTHSWPTHDKLFSQDGTLCLSLQKNTMTLSNLLTGEQELMPDISEKGLRFGLTALSDDARYLAASASAIGGVSDSEVTVWDLKSRKPVGTYGRFLKSAHSVNFSPDGRRIIAAAGGFESVKLWDFESRQELLTLRSSGGPLRNVRFSADGDMISAHDEGHTVYCWRAPSFEQIEAAENQTP